MRPHLDTLSALRAIAGGGRIPAQKYAALQRAHLIKVKGHGSGSKPVLTDAGRTALAVAPAGYES